MTHKVIRGRWILDENPHDGYCRCSVCWVAIDAMNERNHKMLNILTGGKWWTFYHYCPNCGALMVNEDEEMSKVSEMEVAYAEYLND